MCRHCPVTQPALILSAGVNEIHNISTLTAERLNILFLWSSEALRCFLCLRASIFITDVAVMPFPSRVYGCVQGELMLHYTKCLQSVAAFIRTPGHLRPYKELESIEKS